MDGLHGKRALLVVGVLMLLIMTVGGADISGVLSLGRLGVLLAELTTILFVGFRLDLRVKRLLPQYRKVPEAGHLAHNR